MEYALEGHGYSWSRVLRGQPAYLRRAAQGRVALDAEIDDLTRMRAETGLSPAAIEAPADLLAALHVRAPASPGAALALEVGTAVKAVFDGLSPATELLLTHCTFDEGAGGPNLLLGACFPALTAEVAQGDSVSAAVLVTLRRGPGPERGDEGGGFRLDVLARVFRKVCENGALVHDLDEPAVRVALRPDRGGAALRDAIRERITAALDPGLFKRCLEAFQASSVDPLDHRGGPLGALLRNALPYGTWQAVMARFEAEPWTRWGLANAVTAEARWAPSVAELLRLERIGGWLARSPGRAYAEVPPGLLDPAGGAAPIEVPPAEKVPAS